jgi:hypothetical protein
MNRIESRIDRVRVPAGSGLRCDLPRVDQVDKLRVAFGRRGSTQETASECSASESIKSTHHGLTLDIRMRTQREFVKTHPLAKSRASTIEWSNVTCWRGSYRACIGMGTVLVSASLLAPSAIPPPRTCPPSTTHTSPPCLAAR